MSLAPNAAVFRGHRRVRISFTAALGAGAFASTSLYTVTNTDGRGFNPIAVSGVFAVASDPNSVELAVSCDWTDGAAYALGFVAVPAAVGPAFTGTLNAFTPGQVQQLPNAEPAASDADVVLFFRDLAHDGTDYLEDAAGDLRTTTGQSNWQNALVRRELSQGLSWDPSYSPQADQYVDAPAFLQKPLAGRIVSQALADPRTRSATVAVVEDPSNPADFTFQLAPVAQNGAQFVASFAPPTTS